MNRIDVVPSEDGRWKVLHNFIQHGVNYQNRAQAEKEAETLKVKCYPQAKKSC